MNVFGSRAKAIRIWKVCESTDIHQMTKTGLHITGVERVFDEVVDPECSVRVYISIVLFSSLICATTVVKLIYVNGRYAFILFCIIFIYLLTLLTRVVSNLSVN